MTGFGLAQVTPYSWLLNQGTVGTNMHLGFTVDTREDAETFYQAALRAGALSHCPAVHLLYHPDYFGEFIRDPYLINLEAVCHRPPAQ